ncbi:hypothetical protein QVD17_28340 [Tagetes erecta]|uniref:Uncharacterized protein n=1 Tax=Tagetes erecta TaxID=13708 RepID=A0AAD8NSD6_TARER|nr:hypothetical protein QVD17_28340 [Tagetes erecta]
MSCSGNIATAMMGKHQKSASRGDDENKVKINKSLELLLERPFIKKAIVKGKTIGSVHSKNNSGISFYMQPIPVQKLNHWIILMNNTRVRSPEPLSPVHGRDCR